MRNIAGQIRVATTISPDFRMKTAKDADHAKGGDAPPGIRISTQHPLNSRHESHFTHSALIEERMAGGQVRCERFLAFSNSSCCSKKSSTLNDRRSINELTTETSRRVTESPPTSSLNNSSSPSWIAPVLRLLCVRKECPYVLDIYLIKVFPPSEPTGGKLVDFLRYVLRINSL